MQRNHQRAIRKRRNRHSYKSAMVAISSPYVTPERIAVGSNNFRTPNTRSFTGCHLGRTSRADYLLQHDPRDLFRACPWRIAAAASYRASEGAGHLGCSVRGTQRFCGLDPFASWAPASGYQRNIEQPPYWLWHEEWPSSRERLCPLRPGNTSWGRQAARRNTDA